MRVVIGGSSGFLGSHLAEELEGRGHDVVRLVRSTPQAPGERRWDPQRAPLDPGLLDGVDAVVNLTGSSLLGNPHSRRYRQRILDSRVTPTRVLAEAVAASDHRPAFIAGNASAWYGGHGSEVVTEAADSRGDSFMTQVARAWQAAAGPAETAGSRVCYLRTVPVMHPESLVFHVLRPLFRLGLGARLGSGDHYFPVISLPDWVRAAAHLVEHPSAAGPFNLAAPEPPTNREFTEAFADAAGRRALLAAPAQVLRVAAGPLAPDLLDSFRLVPEALEELGFTFADRDVRDVMARAMGGSSRA